jgi:NACalpha-BTF3-like transcription factor
MLIDVLKPNIIKMSEKAKKYSPRNKRFSNKEKNLVKHLTEYGDIGLIAETANISRQNITSAIKSWKTSEDTHDAILSFYHTRRLEKIKDLKNEIEKLEDLN